MMILRSTAASPFARKVRIVVRESLTAYPVLQLKAALAATAQQLVRVATGYGVHTEIWHTAWIIETMAPASFRRTSRLPAASRSASASSILA